MKLVRTLSRLLMACMLLSSATIPMTGALDVMAQAEAEASGKSAAKPVDVNRASAEQLTAVPGIGKTLARRIVEFREQNGPFRRIEDLLKVQGIGEKSLQKLRPHLKLATAR